MIFLPDDFRSPYRCCIHFVSIFKEANFFLHKFNCSDVTHVHVSVSRVCLLFLNLSYLRVFDRPVDILFFTGVLK